MERIAHYEIVRRLGRGGMGEVYEGTDLNLGRRVALKFVAPALASDPETLRRFEREARAAASLHHPRIATLFAFDRTTDRPFIVMELLGGRTLRDLIELGPQPVADAIAITRDVASALAFAHRHGIVHRDIKPENLMFDAEGGVKVTDFGLARTTDALRMTTTGATLGTAAYMAPETVPGFAGTVGGGGRAGPPGSAADVFALGVTVHELLTGSTPFRGDTPLAMLYSIVNEPPRPLREARPDVSPELESLVARMLEKDPAARPTADEVAREFGAPGGAPMPVIPMSRSGAGEVAAAPRGPASVSFAAPIIGILVVVVLGGGWLLQQRLAGREHRAVILNNEGHDSLSAGNLAGARNLFQSALALAPRYGEAKLNLATTLHRGGDDNRAASLYGEVVAENHRRPDLMAEAHYGLGEIDLQAGAWQSAIEHLDRAARADTTRVEYRNNLAFALTQAGRTSEALAVLRSAQRLFPGEATLLKNAALAWFQAGAFDSARAAASEAVRLRPVYPAAWSLKVRSEAALGDLAAARASLEALRHLGPDPTTLAEAESAVREAGLAIPSPPRPEFPIPPR
jgi:Flp pilus assembly protein TadD